METFPNNRMNQYPAQQPPVVFANSQEEQQSSFDFFGILNRRKWIVFLGLCTGLGLGTLVHYQSPPIYESTADIRIEPKNPMVMQMTQTNPLVPDVESILPTRHDRIIPKQVTVESCFEKTDGLYALSSFEDMTREDTIEHVLENLTVVPDKEDNYNYTVSFRTYSMRDSKTVLSNLVLAYHDMLKDRYKSETDKVGALLEEVKRQFENNYRDVLDRIEMEQAKIESPVITANGSTIDMINVTELNQRLRLAQDDLLKLMGYRNRVNAALDSGDTDAMNTMVYNLDQMKVIRIDPIVEDKGAEELTKIEDAITQLTLEYNEASIRFGDGHHQVQAIRTQIDFWENAKKEYLEKLAEEGSLQLELSAEVILRRFLLTTDADIVGLQSRIQKDSKELDVALAEAEKFAKIRDKLTTLERERTKVEELLSLTAKKIVEANPSQSVAGGIDQREGFYFVTLKEASLGERVWPILPILLAIGGFLGGLAGFGLGCLVELADKTFHNPDEVMKQLHLPLIGHVPVISQSKRYLVEDSLIEPVICTYHRPKSQTAEAFRAVRTALFFNTQGKQNSVIQVTSPTPGDGKSTLAANLAVCIAQSGKRVLLVDGDMRRPRQHSTFGISSSEGFATVLSGQSYWRDVVYEVEEIEGLALMPCGAKPNNPSELSTSPQVKELIEQMREEYDFVIIDTPPILAVTDPSPIAARVDGVVLCLRIKKNVKVSAERSTEVLRNLGANIVGVVVNGVGQQTGYGSQYTYGAYRAGYSYNGYGYGYGYGYGSGKYYDEDEKGRANQAVPPRIEAAAPVPPQSSEMFDGVDD